MRARTQDTTRRHAALGVGHRGAARGWGRGAGPGARECIDRTFPPTRTLSASLSLPDTPAKPPAALTGQPAPRARLSGGARAEPGGGAGGIPG